MDWSGKATRAATANVKGVSSPISSAGGKTARRRCLKRGWVVTAVGPLGISSTGEVPLTRSSTEHEVSNATPICVRAAVEQSRSSDGGANSVNAVDIFRPSNR
jgi:hypothetical protein